MKLIQEQFFVVYQNGNGDSQTHEIIEGPFWSRDKAIDALTAHKQKSLMDWRYDIMSNEVTVELY